MHIILDNLSATLIAATILVMIFSVNFHNGQTLTETSVFYGVTSHTEAFAKILRRDLQGIADIETVTEEAQADGSTEFRFESRIGDDTTKHDVTYKKIFSQTRTFDERLVDGTLDSTYTRDFFRVERLVDGVADGGSSDILIDWEIVALNEDAGSISDPDDAAQVYVRFEAASPVVDTDVIQSIKWESRFFPPLRN